MRCHWTLSNNLLLDFLIHHDRHIGHHRLPFFVELGHVYQYRYAVGEERLALFVQFRRLHHNGDIRGNRVAFLVVLGHLDAKGFGELGLGIRFKVLDDALGNEKYGKYHANGQQEVVSCPDQVHPEITNRLSRMPCDPSH